jgi:glycosyltransferase involved in cell wall biosynthesis
MKTTVLVVTTVHWPDDTRIRERLIRTLAADFDVFYAARTPGPSDKSGLRFIELRGGRLRRILQAFFLCLQPTWNVLVLHDPENVPTGLLARLVRRKPVVFDVHEDIPATALSRDWVPGWLRRPMASLLAWLLRRAERSLEITLAEPGYEKLFESTHSVFQNFPDTSLYPDPVKSGNGEVVYLGDVTLERGADLAVDVCARLNYPLNFVGRATDEVRLLLIRKSGERSGLRFEGLLPNPDALEIVGRASVGLSPLRDIPNYRDSQPTKILEYLALGIPVVASDLPGTRSLVDGLDSVYLVRPDAADEFAEAIELAMKPESRESAQAQADAIRSRFRWPVDEVREFYLSLV